MFIADCLAKMITIKSKNKNPVCSIDFTIRIFTLIIWFVYYNFCFRLLSLVHFFLFHSIWLNILIFLFSAHEFFNRNDKINRFIIMYVTFWCVGVHVCVRTCACVVLTHIDLMQVKEEEKKLLVV